jgi:hypothetical protein
MTLANFFLETKGTKQNTGELLFHPSDSDTSVIETVEQQDGRPSRSTQPSLKP